MIRVLVIDDQANLLEEVVEHLEYAGFEAIPASDGLQGVQMARDMLPNIIICDINMPRMNGFEVLEELRNDSSTASIPFIFLSARADHSDIRTGMDQGADDYLTKPVDNEELVRSIRSRLTRNVTYQLNRLREFSHRLVMTQEIERRSLATSLREDLLNTMSDLKMTLSMANKSPQDTQSVMLEMVDKLAEKAIQSVNNLSYSLWPFTLKTLELLPTLLVLFNQFTERTKINVEFEHSGLQQITDRQLIISLYRIIQEALANVEKHTDVPSIQIRLWVEQENVRLQIEDQGGGFNVEQTLREADKVGLISMQERAHLLGGEFTILSSRGSGTNLIGSFPLNRQTSPKSEFASAIPDMRNLGLAHEPPTKDKPGKGRRAKIVRVAIADSNEIMRWGIRSLLEQQSEFAVIGDYTNTRELSDHLEHDNIDILIVSDTLQGGENTLDLIRDVNRIQPNIHIILLSNYMEYVYANEAIKNGVDGYLLRTTSLDEILEALNVILSGKQYIAYDILESLEAKMPSPPENSQMDAFSTLTDREKQIFYLVVNGRTNQDIADQLVISPRTAEAHRLNMMRKLGLKGLHALISFAMDRGLIGDEFVED